MLEADDLAAELGLGEGEFDGLGGGGLGGGGLADELAELDIGEGEPGDS